MNLTQALKAGILPTTANPIEIILTAHKEGLEALLDKQIRRHHQIMRKSDDANEARKNFQVICDFTESELSGMSDLKCWLTDDNTNKRGVNVSSGNTSSKITEGYSGYLRAGSEISGGERKQCFPTPDIHMGYIGALKGITKIDNINRINDMMSSVYIDDSSRGEQSLTIIQSSLSILKSLKRKKIYRPIDDSTVTHCYNCGGAFTLFNRRHHCRACGRIFCYNCSQWNERIPDDLISYTDTKTWIVPGQVSRVCQACKDMINNFRRIEHLVKYFEIVAYPFDLCIRASTLSRDWREAMRIYLSNIRDLQYALPSSPLSDRDQRAIRSNLQYFRSHSKWMLQALKMGLTSIEGKRIKSCQDMMCDRNCTEGLTPFDAIIILNTPIYNVEVRLLALKILQENTFPEDVALFLPIEDPSVQEFVLKRHDLFLDFFWVSRIDQGLATDVFKNKLLLANQDQAKLVQESIHLISTLENYNNLYELSKKLQALKVPFMGPFGTIDKFDSDITIKNSATRPIIIRYYSEGYHRAFLFKQEDVRKDAHVVSLIRLMYYLCRDIFLASKNGSFLPVSTPIEIGQSKGCSGPWFARESPILSPNSLPSSYKYPSFFSNSLYSNSRGLKYPPVESTSSILQPLSEISESINFKPLYNSDGSGSSKRKIAIDSSKHDPSLLAMYRDVDLMDENIDERRYEPSSLQSSFNFDRVDNDDLMYLATYRVMPVSINSGFIEIVPNAATLFEILGKGSISNYLYRSNIDKKVSEISSNYSASLAFWTVVTFLLGVGDRHLENIMIRNDGILFHIDYGFVFGADSTASFVRLDHNLIEGLGGVEMYEPFKAKCCEIYCCLRRHFNLICACLLRLASINPPITGYNFTSEFIEKFVTDRFLLGQTEDEAKEAFSNIIDSSRETLINKVSDVIHNTVSSLKVGWWSY